MSRYSALPLCVTGRGRMLLAYIYRSITHRVHFLDKASRDLLICAKYLLVEANGTKTF